MLDLVAPGGLEEAFRSMREPAQILDLPTETLTYSRADVKETVQRFSEYGVNMCTVGHSASRKLCSTRVFTPGFMGRQLDFDYHRSATRRKSERACE